MALAWALEAAHTKSVGSARDSAGQMRSTALKTRFCTTCVFPEPPCPRRRRWLTFCCSGGLRHADSRPVSGSISHAVSRS
eukprot:7951879-Lingulodinium_polyedra.AAC.1